MLPNGLLDIVKNYMNLSWLDDATNNKLTIIILNGIADLDGKSGEKNDYTVSGRAQSLLLNRTLYEWSNALDDFYINYRNEIVAFINKARAKKYAGEQETSD